MFDFNRFNYTGTFNETYDETDEIPHNNSQSGVSTRHLSSNMQIFITICYVIGIMGNLTALLILKRSETSRNKRQTLMLKYLALNDFIALAGSLIIMYAQLNVSTETKNHRGFCAVRVFWRAFGFGSGCVAIVMAIERFIALMHPFAYQKHVTYHKIMCSIVSLWATAVLLASLPLLGFGLYYNEQESKCMRYREAVTPIDKAYTYLVFTFGLVMCLCIVTCNLAVVIVLCKSNKQRKASVGSFRPQPQNNSDKQNKESKSSNNSTNDEISFAKLMVILCVFFVICWLPQLFSIVITQLQPESPLKRLIMMGDICISMNFILDPFFYVVFRYLQQKSLRDLCQPMCTLTKSASNCETEFKDGQTELTTISSNFDK